MWNLKNKINKQNRNRLIDMESRLAVARGAGGSGGWVKKGKGLRSTNWWLQNSPRDVKLSTGNVVNNIVITMCGARWALEISGGTCCEVHDCLTTMLYT